VAAILVGGMKCRTQFWKRTTQGSFQQSLVEIGSVVSEEKIFLNSSPFFLFLAWRPYWLGVEITGHNFGRGPSKDRSTKVLLQLALWFLRRRFLCEFPLGSYVELSSAVGAILIEGPNRRTHFWKRTIQWLSHQNVFFIEQMVSDKKMFMGISHRVLYYIKFGCGDHLGRSSEMPDTILEEGPPKNHFSKVWLRLAQ
jgi:hypothetical protein